jgi:hypothetical protein
MRSNQAKRRGRKLASSAEGVGSGGLGLTCYLHLQGQVVLTFRMYGTRRLTGPA